MSKPVLEAVDSSNISAKLSKFSNQQVVLNIWSAWCAPCKKELPQFVESARKFKARGVHLMLVSMDTEDSQKNIIPFLKSIRATGPYYVQTGNVAEFIDVLHTSWSGTLPATFLFESGKLVRFVEGPLEDNEIEALFQSAVK